MDPFEHENAFYLSCQPVRIAKFLAQAECFRRSLNVPGEIVECGVFKGASFARWAMLRDLMSHRQAKRLIGFDTFGEYFPADTIRDDELRANVVRAAGDACISQDRLVSVLTDKGCADNVELIAGDIRETVPKYVEDHPELRISLLNLDVDFGGAAGVILEHLWPRISTGGVLILDDYGTFEGETRAVDRYFRGAATIQRMPYAYSPCFVVKK